MLPLSSRPRSDVRSRASVFAAAALLAAVSFSSLSWAQAAPDGASSPAAAGPQGTARITPQKKKLYEDALAAARIRNGQIRSQMDKLRKEREDLLSAPGFDKAAYLAKSSEIDGLSAQMHKNLAEAAANVLAQMSSEERKAIAHSGSKAAARAGKKSKSGKRGAIRARKSGTGSKSGLKKAAATK